MPWLALRRAAVNLASLCQQAISVGLVVGGFYLFNAGESAAAAE